MKKVITLFAAATIAVNVFGGLFDNVTKSVIGTLSPEERERQRKAETEERERKFWENNARIRAEQEERLRREEAARAEQEKESERRRAAIIAEQEERARQEEAARAEQEKVSERRRAAIIAEQEERARQEELRKAEEHKAYMARLEKAEQERRKREQEAAQAERERQEAEMAERQRKREKERAERVRIAAEKEAKEKEEREECERIQAAEMKRIRLRACRDGSLRESFYVQLKDVKSALQFPSQKIIPGSVPLYKAITSGSTLMWSIGQLLDFTGEYAFGGNVKIQSMRNIDINGFDYDGISVAMPKKKDSAMLCLYCSSEGLDKNIETIEDSILAGVVVFGVGNVFPDGIAADDVMGRLKERYSNLKVSEKRWVTEDFCLDLVGLKRKATHLRLGFENEDVKGIVEEEKCEFEKFDLNSSDACFMLYFNALEALKRTNRFAAEEFEQSFNTAMLEVRANVKNGKCKKDIAGFKFGAGSIDDFKKGEQLSSETVFIMNTAARQVLSECSHSQLKKDAIARGKAEMLNIQSELLKPGSQSANVLSVVPRISASMKIFDGRALEILPALKRSRKEARQREEQSRKDAQKANSLDF